MKDENFRQRSNIIKKLYTSVTYFTKTEYCRPLVTNVESVEKTTNTSFKIYAPHLFRKTNQILFWSNTETFQKYHGVFD